MNLRFRKIEWTDSTSRFDFTDPQEAAMLGIQLGLNEYLDACCRVIHALHLPDIQGLSDDLYEVWQRGQFVFVCGNGERAQRPATLQKIC